jgi:hypothetical protein
MWACTLPQRHRATWLCYMPELGGLTGHMRDSPPAVTAGGSQETPPLPRNRRQQTATYVTQGTAVAGIAPSL